MVIRRNVLMLSELTGVDSNNEEQWSEPIQIDGDAVRTCGFSMGYGECRDVMLDNAAGNLILSTRDYDMVFKQPEDPCNPKIDYYKCKVSYGKDLKVYIEDDTAFIYERHTRKVLAQAWFEEVGRDFDPFHDQPGQSVMVLVPDEEDEGVCLNPSYFKSRSKEQSCEMYTLNIPWDFVEDILEGVYEDSERNLWALRFVRKEDGGGIHFYFRRGDGSDSDDLELDYTDIDTPCFALTPDEVELDTAMMFSVYEEGKDPDDPEDRWSAWLLGGYN